MLYLSLVVSAVGLFLMWRLMRNPKRGPGTYLLVGVPAAVVLPCVCMGILPPVFCTMAAATAGAVGWHYAGRRRAAVFPVLFAALVVGFAIPLFSLVLPRMRMREELQNEVTVLNADERLRRPAAPAVPAVLRTTGLSALDNAVREDWSPDRRTWQFSQLHGRAVDAFVNSPGFGVIRMREQTPSREVYLPTRPPMPQPTRDPTSQSRPSVEHPFVTPPTGLSAYHTGAVIEFTFPFGWGWERSPGEFLGFQPHQFGQPARYEYNRGMGLSVNDWRVDSVDLIGLVVRARPTVYMTDNLPRMDEAKTAPTREPDGFEAAGLKAVANGQELYLGRARTGDVLRMVGGIRAAKSCTTCHGCQEGELLGAFGYVLTK